MSLVRLALACLLALAGLVLVGAPAHACSCAIEGPRAAFDRSDAVFTAEVLDRTSDDRGLATYGVQVQRVYKGEPVGDVVVVSSASGASCGLEGISLGQTRLFLVTGQAPVYAGNLCLGSGVSQSEAERLLGPPTDATAPADPAAEGADGADGAVTDGGGIGVQVDDVPVWPWLAGGALGFALLAWGLRRVLVGTWW